MSDNYEGESFDNESNKSSANAPHKLKLSIDIMSIRNLAMSANVFVSYELMLTD